MIQDFDVCSGDVSSMEMYYSGSNQENRCIGHIRGDFGKSGDEYWATFWEHEGIMDNQDYMDYAIRKERAYIKDGYLPGDKLILTSETLNHPLDPDIVKLMIEKYCL